MTTITFILVLCAILDFGFAYNTTELHAVEERISSYELLKHLTHPGRYSHGPPGPVNIVTRLYLYNAQVVHNLRYSLNMLVQYQYRDERLAYEDIAPDVSHITGGEEVRDLVWTPHVYFVNDQKSAVMGSLNKDISVSVLPDGTIIFTQRIKTLLTCWMKLHKFPFDNQQCSLMLESWMYDSTHLTLQWEKQNPVSMTPKTFMSEFYISNMWTNSSRSSDFYRTDDYELRASSGNYSALMVTFQLHRQIGFYIMDYYLPSMLLVFMSWVSFWLDASALSGRTNLGVSTLLTLIALSSKTSSALPKVSYVLASEVWFIVCTAFIVSSLVEFAFVNVISRRGNNVELKKVSSKYIFKSTVTPKQAKRELEKRKAQADRTTSCPPHYISPRNTLPLPFTAQGPAGLLSIPKLLYIHDEELEYEGGHVMRLVQEDDNTKHASFTTMSPHQIAKWIDTKSRFMFPALFFMFNILYWGSMSIDWILDAK